MPNYDRECAACGEVKIDCLEPVATADMACACGGVLKRVWFAKPAGVISDECDIWVKHGICNEDGSPRHYRFKSEMARVAKERSVVNKVEHIGSRGSDKNPHTSRWV